MADPDQVLVVHERDKPVLTSAGYKYRLFRKLGQMFVWVCVKPCPGMIATERDAAGRHNLTASPLTAHHRCRPAQKTAPPRLGSGAHVAVETGEDVTVPSNSRSRGSRRQNDPLAGPSQSATDGNKLSAETGIRQQNNPLAESATDSNKLSAETGKNLTVPSNPRVQGSRQQNDPLAGSSQSATDGNKLSAETDIRQQNDPLAGSSQSATDGKKLSAETDRQQNHPLAGSSQSATDGNRITTRGRQVQQQQQQGDPDPISRFKSLLPRLRESLANLFRDAALLLRQNAAQDSGSQQDIQRLERERIDKFEKRLEDFFALCDQIEISLKLALELHHQALDSMKNTPQSVMISKPPPDPASAAAVAAAGGGGGPQQQEGQSYAQYLTTMRQQISFSKEVHDMLTDAATKLLEKSLPHPPAPSAASGPGSAASMQAGTPLSQQQHTPLSSQQQD